MERHSQIWLGVVITDSHSTTTSSGGRLHGCTPTLLGEMWGHLPGREQCNYRAEVYALRMALMHLEREGASNMTAYIVTDCKGGWVAGKRVIKGTSWKGQQTCGEELHL